MRLILVLKDAAKHNRRHKVFLPEVTYLATRGLRLKLLGLVYLLEYIFLLDLGGQMLFLTLSSKESSYLAC